MKRIALFFALVFLLAYAAKSQTVDSLWNGYLSPFVQTGGTAPSFTVQGQFVSNGGFSGSQIELSKKPRLIVYSSNKCYELPFTALSGTGSIIAGTVIDRSGQLSAIPSGSAVIYQPSSVYRIGPFPTGISAALQGCLQTYNNLKIDSLQTGGITVGDKQDIDVVSTNVWVIDTNAVTTIKIANSAVDSNKIAANAVRSSDIGTAQVTMPKIDRAGATNGQVLKWNGAAWAPAGDDNTGNYVPGTGIDITGNIISNTGVTEINGEVGPVTGVVFLTDPVGDTGGDVTGTIDEMTVVGVQGQPLTGDSPTSGQVLKWNGTAWDPADDASGGGGVVEPANQVVVGTGSGATSAPGFTYNPTTSVARVNGILSMRTGDTTGIINIVRNLNDEKFGLHFGGTQEHIAKIVKDSRATTAAITDFNVVRSWLEDGGNSGGNNQAVLMGYNVTAGGSLQNTSQAGMWLSFENNYRNNVLDPTQFEFHFPQISYPDGSVRRVFSGIFSNDQSRKQGSLQMVTDLFAFNDFKTNTNKVLWQFATGGAKGISFLDTARLAFYINNAPILQQKGTGAFFIELAKVNSLNEVELSPQGRTLYTSSDTMKTQFGLTVLTAADQNFVARTNTFEVNAQIAEVLKMSVNGTLRATHRQDGDTWNVVGRTGNYVFRSDLTAPDNSFSMSNSGQISLGGSYGTWNSRLDVVSGSGPSARLQEWRNSSGQNGVYRSNVTPEGNISANPGDFALTNISTTGGFFIKKTGTGTSGWEQAITTSGISTSVNRLMHEESFTATSAQTAFTIAYSAPAVSGTSVPLRVYRNGVRLFYTASGPTSTQFTYSGTTVTTIANTAGDVITVEYLN